jgi:hypothetical protein
MYIRETNVGTSNQLLLHVIPHRLSPMIRALVGWGIEGNADASMAAEEQGVQADRKAGKGRG